MKKRGKKAKKEKAENEAENGTGRKGKKVRYTPSAVLRRVILIFAALYLAGMGISTALVQQKFRQDHQRYLGDIADLVKLSMSEEIRDATAQGKEVTSEWFANRLEFFLALCSSDPYVNWNAAVWDSEGDKIAERGAIASAPLDGDSTARVIWHLKDYLTEEELDQLAEYAAQETASEKRQWTEYEENVSYTPEGELASISIQKEKWKKVDSLEAENLEGVAGWARLTEEDGSTKEEYFVCITSEEAWRWENPDTEQEEAEIVFGSFLFIPGSEAGENGWKEWRTDEYLQSFPEHIRGGYREDGTGYMEYTDDNAEADLTIPLAFEDLDSESGVRVCTMMFRMISHSWMAAADYMKYVYLGSAVFVAACIVFAAYTLEKSYRKNAETEAQRRDFTNAMAHEMKTPLGVIRGFAENLLEDPETGKREYYLRQIIGQTEEMDGAVKEMIQVSRLDSEDLALSRERIDLSELLEEEMERIAVRTEERRIEVRLRHTGAAVVEGDRALLEKAFRCLLDNAVSYNRDEGIITIDVDEERCVMANTGDPIPEEDLSRVCEMLWTGSREGRTRASEEKHLGMGLYLADRIFRLHGMKMTVENTQDGVQVSVDWSGR